MTQYWFNLKTHQVEEGPQSPGIDRAGPYASREEAAKAVATMRARTEAWDAEDAADR
jgi:hypothetical protein